jgi:photosystem II stability/assembly factor-like uncharacterized protein
MPVGPPLPAGRPLSKVAVLNDQDAVVAGDGVILRTADGGAHWTPVYDGAAKVRMLHWVDSRNLVAATSMGLLKSRDGGYHWQVVNQRVDLVRLHFIDPINGFAIAGAYPDYPGGYNPLTDLIAGTQLVRTSDGGANFRVVSSALPIIQWVQFVTPRHGWAAGPDGIETTLDGGGTWQVQLRFPSTLFRDSTYGMVYWGAQVGFRDDLHGFVFYRAAQTVMGAGAGRLYYTDNGGQHWQLQSYSSPGDTGLGAPATLPWSVNGELVVTGPSSAMLMDWDYTTYATHPCRSSDAGRTWNCATLRFTGAATGQLAVRDGIEWLAVTDDNESVAEIAISRDGGSSWQVDRFLIPDSRPMPTVPAGAVGTWTNLALLKDYHGYGSTSALMQDGRVLVCGGGNPRTTCEIYDPRTNAWSLAASMPGPAGYQAIVLKSGDVLVMGSQDSSGPQPDARGQLYRPSLDRWDQAPGAAVRYGSNIILLADGRLLVTGGRATPRTTSGVVSAEIYDPGTDRWSSAGSMKVARVGHAAVLLPDSRVLVTGGDDSLSAEVYDPRSNTWKLTGSRHVDPHYPPVLIVLPGGRVLAASDLPSYGIDPNPGLGPQQVPGPRAELFDPASGTWSPLSGAPDDLPGFTVTLPDGRVLFVATYGGGRGALYDPRTDRWAPIPDPPPQVRAVVSLLDGRVLAIGGIHAAVYTAP